MTGIAWIGFGYSGAEFLCHVDEHVRESVADPLLVDIDVDGLCHTTLLVGL
nr:MAG TPA_asm: hypothetical protein [Caudoviricetes sp.]